MYLKKIEVHNFRLLENANFDLEQDSTIIVGKNNSGKTSLLDVLFFITNNMKPSFDDYPIGKRQELYESINSFLKEELDFNDLLEVFAFPSIKLYVDYSLESEDEELGFLAPFIINLNESISEVHIHIEYSCGISPEKMKSFFESIELESENTLKNIKEIIKEDFSNMVIMNIFSINPEDKTKKRKIETQIFKKLFPIHRITAERALDESGENNNNPLNSLVSEIFKDNLIGPLKDVESKIDELKKICKEVKNKSQTKINELLNDIAKKSLEFGYPAAEDLKLNAETKIELEKQIQSSVSLSYKKEGEEELLPSSYNGLGYKNLIKIELQLLDFANKIEEQIENSIPLIFIEEPESHMHPQMQQKFIQYIDDFFGKISDKKVQIIITTHSSHIINSSSFEKIRYIKKEREAITIMNFSSFCYSEDNNKDFIKKYLNINRCDLFFADKAILVEGTAERLLIPDMIKKLYDRGIISEREPSLYSQYYSLIEIGGAYAFKFIPFLRFLGIPTLIITDIDSIDSDSKACIVSEGVKTSNATIKYWFKKILEKEDCNLGEIKNLEYNKKTYENIHIEYQIEELSLCGRSLEESIKNVNRSLYEINEATEENLKFNTNKDGSKTDFAMSLLFEESKKNYLIPKYISDGLVWLNNQTNGR